MPVRFALTLALTLALAAKAGADTINFGDLNLPAGSFYNGSDLSKGFTSGGAHFNNSYNTTYGSWTGWAYSNINNTTDPSYTNQYAASAGAAPSTSPTGVYAVSFGTGAFINLPAGTQASSMILTNTTYTYFDIKNGDPYGFDPAFVAGDYLILRILGKSGANGSGSTVGEVDVPLADYRDGKKIDLNTWQSVELGPLGSAQSLAFDYVASSDHYSTYKGQTYLDTPAYFALASLTVAPAAVPEPASLALLGLGAGLAVVVRGRRRAG